MGVIRATSVDNAWYSAQWTDVTANITAVSHNPLPAGVTMAAEDFDNDAKTTRARLSGIQHGVTYSIPVVLTLDSGETVKRAMVIRGFD